MIIWPVVLANMLFQPVGDTVWWNTEGGNVTEFRDRDVVTCSLTLNSAEGRFIFVWDNTMPAHVAVASRAWNNTPGQTVNVAVRIGNVWLDRGTGSPNISAMTDRSAFMFALNEPVEDLLMGAADIAIRTPGTGLQIALTRPRTASLIAALRKCRAIIGRAGG